MFYKSLLIIVLAWSPAIFPKIVKNNELKALDKKKFTRLNLDFGLGASTGLFRNFTATRAALPEGSFAPYPVLKHQLVYNIGVDGSIEAIINPTYFFGAGLGLGLSVAFFTPVIHRLNFPVQAEARLSIKQMVTIQPHFGAIFTLLNIRGGPFVFYPGLNTGLALLLGRPYQHRVSLFIAYYFVPQATQASFFHFGLGAKFNALTGKTKNYTKRKNVAL